MARSEYDKRNLLNLWQEWIAVNKWTFNQVTGSGVPVDTSKPLVQRERDTVALALEDAFQKVRIALGYPIQPEYVVEEIILPPNCFDTLNDQYLYTRNGYLQAFGKRATTLIEADAAITYGGTLVGGIGETGTITVSTDVDASEIQVFFRVADGAASAASETWRIPATVSASGGTATITVDRANCVQPSIWAQPFEAPNFNPEFRNSADSGTAGDFITAVDVYRVYTDATDAAQVQILDGTSAPEYQTVTPHIVDEVNGGFVLTGAYSHRRVRLRVSYLAGVPLLPTGKPDTQLLEATIRLANSAMAANVLPNFGNAEVPLGWRKWEEDRKTVPTELQNRQDRRFGTLFGQMEAARIVSYRQNYTGGYRA